MEKNQHDEVIIDYSNDDFNIQGTGSLDKADLSRALEVSNVLQSTLNIENLFHLFVSETQKTVHVCGLTYVNTDLNLHILIGKKGDHLCTYRLLIEDENLGELMVFSMKQIAASETIRLENLLSSLLYPLRNAIVHSHALETTFKDPLTGVNNQAALKAVLKREIALALRHKSKFTVLVAGTNQLQAVKSKHGNLYADYVLKEIAVRILQSIRGSDIVFRHGKDKFLILLSNTNKNGALLSAQRIQSCISREFELGEKGDFALNLSMGATTLLENDDRTSLIGRADDAMEQAKKSDKNSVIFDG